MRKNQTKQQFEIEVEKFKQLLEKGYSIRRASKECIFAINTGYQLVKSRNLVVKSKNCTNLTYHTYFKNIDAEAKAYLLGFILADGSIQKKYGINTIALNNSIDDEEAINLFKSEICPENKITRVCHEFKKDVLIIKCSSEIIIKDLEQFNIKANKTFDFDFWFPFEKLEDKYVRHFIRGFFDGDGTITQGRFEFITTSKRFSTQLSDIICKLFGVELRLRERQTKNVVEYMFYFKSKNRKEYLQKVYKYLYEDSNYFLTRKKVKFETYI